MLSKLVAALQSIDPDLTAKDIAEAIWLARHMGRPQAATSLDSDVVSSEMNENSSLAATAGSPPESVNSEKSLQTSVSELATSNLYLNAHEEETEGNQQVGTLPFRTPAVVALPEALDIARALRPFMHRVPLLTKFVLNEEATAERSAEEGRWVPILDYAQTRWLDVALVIDKGTSMAIWQQTIMEFYLLLARHGAFRDVRIWELDTNDKESIRLYVGTGAGLHNRQPRNELELIDASQRRLTLVVTDCISPAWRSGIAAKTLEKWGHHNPVTLVQVLPQLLWSRTTLKRAQPAHLRISSPGIPNIKFEMRESNYWYKVKYQTGIPLPIVTLEPKPLANWARAIARAEDIWIQGFKLATSPKEESVSPPLSAQERVQRFRANASPSAYRLAGLLTAVPISLPIIRLIQRTILPESDQIHLAEVFLSGLLKVASANSDTLDPDYVQYNFIDGVRELLVPSVSISDTSRVLAKITDFIEENFGNALDFRALLANPLATNGLSISKESLPFAKIAARILRPLGGDYVSLANWLENAAIDAPAQEQSTRPATSIEKGTPSHGIGKQVQDEGVISSEQTITSNKVVHDFAELRVQEIIDSGEKPENVSKGTDNKKEWGDASKRSYITKDFLISYHSADRSWAEWIAWHLEENHYSVVLQAWNFQLDANFPEELDKATKLAERIIVVYSDAYLNVLSTMSEWTVAFLQTPNAGLGLLLPIRVNNCNSDALLGSTAYLDLIGLNKTEACEQLLLFVRHQRAKKVKRPDKTQRSVSQEPPFPGSLSSAPGPIKQRPEEQETHISLIEEQLKLTGWILQEHNSMSLAPSKNIAVKGHPSFINDYLLFIDVELVGRVKVKQIGETLVGTEEPISTPQISQGWSASNTYGTAIYGINQYGSGASYHAIRFVYESNGNETRFTNYLELEPRNRAVFTFHRPEILTMWLKQAPPNVPTTMNDLLRSRLRRMPPLQKAELNNSQFEAITNLEKSLAANHPRSLIQMAPGTGKTHMAVSAIYRLLKFGGARRILFLVDRTILAQQSFNAFQQYTIPDDSHKLSELYNIQYLQSNQLDSVSRVCIMTIQRLHSILKGDTEPWIPEDQLLFEREDNQRNKLPPDIKYRSEMPMEYFDIIFIYDFHPSISQKWRLFLEYFDAFLIGITHNTDKRIISFFYNNLVYKQSITEVISANRFKLPAVLIGGPPLSGKSVLLYQITQALRARGIPHHAIRTSPDGEGNWFHEEDPETVSTIRVKLAEASPEFVQRLTQDLEHRCFPFLVDTGGRPQASDMSLFRACTHSILLLRSDQPESTQLWQRIIKENNLLLLAQFTSKLEADTLVTDGTDTVDIKQPEPPSEQEADSKLPDSIDTVALEHSKLTSEQNAVSSITALSPILEGTLTGLERHVATAGHGPPFDALVERIAALFNATAHDTKKAYFEQAPTELVLDLGDALRTFTTSSTHWEPEMLQPFLASLPVQTPLSVYGIGPNWLHAALAAHQGQQPFYLFGPKLGWVQPTLVYLGRLQSPEIHIVLQRRQDAAILNITFPHGRIDYFQPEPLIFPSVSTEEGIVIYGRVPNWLLTALVQLYKSVGVPWIATFYVPLNKSVVVYSRVQTYRPGDLVSVPI